MKKLILHVVLIFLPGLFSLSGAAQYAALPADLDGSMMPYDFSECTPVPVMPDTLKPVYAAYVARHGARYLSGAKKMKPVMDALERGEANGTLSATGEAFLKLMKDIKAANESNWGDLSPIGIAEERELGRRMYATLSALSDGEARVSCISSFVPRAVMTMYQFTNQLIRLNDQMSVATDEGPEFSPLLYMFACDPAYAAYRKDGSWKEFYKQFEKKHVPEAPARRLFTITDLSDKKLRDLTLDMYEVLKANRAASLPAPTTEWMTEEEYRECWQTSNLQHYLRNCVSAFSDIPAKATLPLLRKIIDNTQKAIDKPEASPALNGYFGHAETLMPLLSLIGVPVANDINPDLTNLENVWKIQEIVPLGANLLILVSRSDSGRYYVFMQLNGKTVVPVPGYGEIVSWENLRNYWEEIISKYSR